MIMMMRRNRRMPATTMMMMMKRRRVQSPSCSVSSPCPPRTSFLRLHVQMSSALSIPRHIGSPAVPCPPLHPFTTEKLTLFQPPSSPGQCHKLHRGRRQAAPGDEDKSNHHPRQPNGHLKQTRLAETRIHESA